MDAGVHIGCNLLVLGRLRIAGFDLHFFFWRAEGLGRRVEQRIATEGAELAERALEVPLEAGGVALDVGEAGRRGAGTTRRGTIASTASDSTSSAGWKRRR